MTYTGGLVPTFKVRANNARNNALAAAAQELINGLKDPKPLGLRGGYTSGKFVTGNLLNSIQATDPYFESGAWHISVYTDVDYAAFWEEGHENRFTRRREQEERWKPTLRRKEEDIVRVYARVYSRIMG